MLGRDSRTGQVYSVKEYFPQREAELSLQQDARMRSFIMAAKSLRKVAVPSMRALFPYTAEGHWYTASLPVAGTPLQEHPGKAVPTEAKVRMWFRAILVALQGIHNEVIETGPLYHGDVTLANLRVQEQGHMPGQGANHYVQLANSTYLEQFLTEVQLPPEYFIEHDLRGAGLTALTLLDGKQHTGDQSQRLDAVRDVVLGATLDYLFRPADKKPGSAEQLLNFFDEMSRAEAERSRKLYEAAYQVSGSTRLRSVLNAAPAKPTPPMGAPPLAPPAAASPPPRPMSSPPPAPKPPLNPAPNPPAPLRPQSTSPPAPSSPQSAPPPRPGPPPASQPARKPAGMPPRPATPPSLLARVGQLVKAAMLLFITLAGAAVVGVALLIRSFLAPEPPKPPTIVAEPGTIHHGQNALLRWTASGFSHVELNGQPVKPNGWRAVAPIVSTSYRLTVEDAKGKTQSVETRLVVVPLAYIPHKPRPGVGKGPPANYSDPSNQPK